MRIGVSSHGRNCDNSSAIGRMMTILLTNDPLAMRQIMGNSRFGSMPVTYCGVTAASSMTTPAAFAPALPVAAAISSVDAAAARARAATSSSSAASPPLIGGLRGLRGGRGSCVGS